MKLNPNITPVIRPPRKVPKPMEDKVKKELHRMTELGVITPIEELTEWVSHMVATRKKNSDDMRLCINPKDLNVALKRRHRPMRTVEEVTMNLTDAKVFITLDAKSSFWQVLLDDESSKLTCFNTPLGRYRFLRMPYGISSGSEVFQRTMEVLFTGYPCKIIVDDILVTGGDMQEHNQKLDKVLQRVLKLDYNSTKINVSSDKPKFRMLDI